MKQTTVIFDGTAITNQPRGGISRYTIELSRNLRRDGYAVDVFAGLHHNQHVGEDCVGLRLPNLRGLSRVTRPSSRIIEQLYYFRRKYDIWHQTWQRNWPVPNHRLRVMTVYDCIPEIFGMAVPDLDVKRECINAADAVICISHFTADTVRDIYGTPASKLFVTHLGTDWHEDTQVARRTRPRLLYVGLRAGYKNFRVLLECLSELASEIGPFDLTCCGGGAFTEHENRTFSGLAGKVFVTHSHPPDEQLKKIVRNSDALIVTSLIEGFGLPVIEGMACGTQVVCSDIPVFREIAGNCATFFNAETGEGLVAGVKRIVGLSETERAESVRSAKLHAGTFTWGQCAFQTTTCYRALCP